MNKIIVIGIIIIVVLVIGVSYVQNDNTTAKDMSGLYEGKEKFVRAKFLEVCYEKMFDLRMCRCVFEEYSKNGDISRLIDPNEMNSKRFVNMAKQCK